MEKRPILTPTRAELEILQILWKNGPCTVRDIHKSIGRPTGYTTILKLLQIMTVKDLVERKPDGRAHIYKARVVKGKATGDFMRELVERVFGGSCHQLVMQALGQGKPSRKELGEIRELINKLEKDEK